MYLRVVVRIALRCYQKSSLELDDIIQEGCLGLSRAITQYDSSRHGNLVSYVSLWIQQFINRAEADKSRMIRIPVHANDLLSKILLSKDALFQLYGREPTPYEIADELGTTTEAVDNLLDATQDHISWESFLSEEGNNELIFRRFARLSIDEEFEERCIEEAILDCLDSLTPRESRVVKSRYGLQGEREKTLDEIGSEFQVTRERIRQIEAKALRKLRHPSRLWRLKEQL